MDKVLTGRLNRHGPLQRSNKHPHRSKATAEVTDRATHIAPVVPAGGDVRIRVAHAIPEPQPIPGAIGELGDNGGVKAGRVPTVKARNTASIDRSIEAGASAAALSCCRVDIQSRAGTDGRVGDLRVVTGHSGAAPTVNRNTEIRLLLLLLLLLHHSIQ